MTTDTNQQKMRDHRLPKEKKNGKKNALKGGGRTPAGEGKKRGSTNTANQASEGIRETHRNPDGGANHRDFSGDGGRGQWDRSQSEGKTRETGGDRRRYARLWTYNRAAKWAPPTEPGGGHQRRKGIM